MGVSSEEFIQVWQGSDSVEQVCKRTGMLSAATRSRAAYLRRNGVALKKFRVSSHDFGALAQLAERLAPKKK